MKKLYTLLFVVFIFTFSACSSDDESSKINTEQLFGKWTLNQSIYNGQQETLSDCDKKQTFDFSNDNRLIITTYSGNNCNTPDATVLNYTFSNNVITYTNPTGGFTGGEFTRKYRVNKLTNNNLEIELFYEIDGTGEEGELSDKWITVWVK